MTTAALERTIAVPLSTTDEASAAVDPASPPPARADDVLAPSVASTSPAGVNATSGASAVSPPPTAAQALITRRRPMGKQPRPMGKQPREQPVRAREGGDDEHQNMSDGEEKEEEEEEEEDEDDDSSDTDIDERRKVSGGKRPASTQSGFSKIKPPMKRLVVPNALPSGIDPIEWIVDYRGKPGKYTAVLAVFEVSKKMEWVDIKDMRNMHVFKYDLETVRLWKESGVDSLARYLNIKVGEVRKAPPHDADNDRMTCGYDSVGIALELLSLPNPVTPNLISEFRTVGAKRRKLSADKFERLGVTWPALRAFARTLSLIDMATLDKNPFTGCGVGVDALAALNLSDGIYLVGGRSKSSVGHCFVVEISCNGEGVWIHDKELEDVEWLHQWLATVSFVRRVLPANKDPTKG